jgi:acyl carrier protein phosphodiesterase
VREILNFAVNKYNDLNYLAHILLSGNFPQIQVGNFIGDFVKGNAHTKYPRKIAKGIILHRKIDDFTDNHSTIKQLKELLRPQFGRYSGIVGDMYFDYFLALNFKNYSRISLNWFACRFYLYLLLNYKYLPQKVKNFVFHFIFSNRLGKYATTDGLRSSLDIMARHKIPALNADEIIVFLDNNHYEIEMLFFDFFPSIKNFIAHETKNIN